MEKHYTLFNPDDFIARPLPEQEEFETENLDFLSDFPEIIDKAFERTQKELDRKSPLSINKNWFANTMNGNIISFIAQKHYRLLRQTGRGCFYLNLSDRFEVYVKKLNNRTFMPSYNHSITSEAMINQRALPHQVPLPVIYVGYTCDKRNSVITGCYAVCIKGKDLIWRTDLVALKKSYFDKNLREEKIEKIPLVTVKPKKGKSAK